MRHGENWKWSVAVLHLTASYGLPLQNWLQQMDLRALVTQKYVRFLKPEVYPGLFYP